MVSGRRAYVADVALGRYSEAYYLDSVVVDLQHWSRSTEVALADLVLALPPIIATAPEKDAQSNYLYIFINPTWPSANYNGYSWHLNITLHEEIKSI
jgi:hypothetical protein